MTEIRVEGLERVLRQVAPASLNAPLRRFHERSTTLLQNTMRTGVPADEGRLRGAITRQVSPASPPLESKVGVLGAAAGSPLFKQAAAMEYGTGLLADGPFKSGKAHFPRPSALEGWARRHGMSSGWAVAIRIFRRGGLKPRRYIRNAKATFERSQLRGEVSRLEHDLAAAMGGT